jgi:hypothetical protein
MRSDFVFPSVFAVFILLIQIQPSAAQGVCTLESLRNSVIDEGFDESTLEVLDSGEVKLHGKDFLFSKFSDDLGNRGTYYMDCETNDVYDHRPSFSEVTPEAAKLKITPDLWAEMQRNPSSEFEIIVYKDASTQPSIEDALTQLESHGLQIISHSELETTGSVMFVARANAAEIGEISKLSWVKGDITKNSRNILSGIGNNGYNILAMFIITVGIILALLSFKLGRKLMILGLIVIVIGGLLLAAEVFSSNQGSRSGIGPGCICMPLGDEALLKECAYDVNDLETPETFGSYEKQLISAVSVGQCDESFIYQKRGSLYIDEGGTYVECACIW